MTEWQLTRYDGIRAVCDQRRRRDSAPSTPARRPPLDTCSVTVVTCNRGYRTCQRGQSVAIDVTERIRAARALRSRPFALLWSGQTISALGDGAYTPALALQALALTHSSAALAAIIAATIVPRLIFLLVGGLVA